MPRNHSRAKFFQKFPKARAMAALETATKQQNVTPGALKIKKGQFTGKTAVVIGSGVGGLTTAYELLASESGMEVTVLEAQNRTGGRCLSLRTGDTLTEDKNSELYGSSPGETQVVRFKQPTGDEQPYLNAGPGRIPSSHKRLLSYLKKFSVDVEVYVMNSESNLVQMKDGPYASQPIAYRRLDHNTRGWLAEMVYDNATELLRKDNLCIPKKSLEERTAQLEELMISFGELIPTGDHKGKYQVTAGEDGLENARSRAGYTQLPGVSAGEIAEALSFDSLLESEFWDKTSFYQPADFLWQPTLFQPVGGMDQVQHAFAQQVAALGGTIHLNSPVKTIDWNEKKQKYVISASQIGTEDCIQYEADYCFSNVAMPFLSKMLSDNLQSNADKQGFCSEFNASLQAIYSAQFSPKTDGECDDTGYVDRFLACTTKVGWQADRSLWQGTPVGETKDNGWNLIGVPDSEVGVVPIFGGISWTDDEILQIWYPSTGYHDEKGVLTGAYNFSETAYEWGESTIDQRLVKARSGASLFGNAFAEGLHDGIAIAWQNMPYIKGGWAQWHAVGDTEIEAVDHFNVIVQGTGVYDNDGVLSDPNFFIVGDQISSLPGWQEGAIAAALNAVNRAARPDLEIPKLACLPDTRVMVEGI
ncbi:amine oxidase [Gammaproteobacteria bacterium 45_16_T64]|nr:amine oxidase [Gammaproteobacteria bacterium 45_16_T64]